MLAPLHGGGVARVVTAGLHRYIRRRKAQLSVLGVGVAVMLPQCGWTFAQDAWHQVAQGPPDGAFEAWAATVLAANALRVAACAALCFGAARHVDARQDRAEEVAALLASRQEALHRFAAEVLGPSSAGAPEEAGSATAFREWFLAQMAASDALLRQLRVGEDSVAAARHLHAAMERLGLTAAELQRMGVGELAGGEPRRGVAVPLKQQKRIEGRRRPRPPSRIAAHNEAMQQERTRLERLLRLTTRGDHAAAFREYLAEMETHLERCMQEQGQADVEGGEAPCAPESPLTAFDEDDCQRGAADPEGIDWAGLAAEWELLDQEWRQQQQPQPQEAREAAGGGSGSDSADPFPTDSE